jgi:hypothetical protein
LDQVAVGRTSTTTIVGNGATSTFSGGLTLATGNINLPTGGVYLINNAAALTASALGSSILSSSLTSVGALDAGSITSGFGAIDTGADNITTTGLGSFGNLALTGSSTLQNFTGINATTTNATSTTFQTNKLGVGAQYFTNLVGTGLQNSAGTLTLNATGDWTGTFDGQEGSYYLDAKNLQNFGNPFYTLFAATTTDALTQGSTNKYFSQTLFDNRLAATSSVASITSLANLATAGALNAGSITSGFGAIDIGVDTLAAGNTTITGTIGAGTTTITNLVVQNTTTSTFVGGVSAAALAVTGSGTSTLSNGIRLAGGCYQDQAGNCIGTGGVTSVSNSDTTLTISPTSGAVVASLNLSKANTWTGLQQFSANASSTAFSALVQVATM